METTWGQPQTLKGLSRFLVEHEPCGAGFDVSHPAGLGSGKVSMTCRGCGVTYEYATATIEFEREVEFEPVTIRRSPDAEAATPPLPPPSPLQPPSRAPAIATGAAPTDEARIDTPQGPVIDGPVPARPRTPPVKAKGRKKKSSRDRMIVAVLLLLSAAAFAFAVIRVTGQNSEESPGPAPTPTPAAVTPAPAKPSQPAAKPEPQAASPKAEEGRQPAKSKNEAEPATRPRAGEKAVKTERFSIIVPSEWQQRDADGGVLLSPPNASPVSVQIFYENEPGMTKQVLAAQTADFLRSRDPGAKIGATKYKSVASNPGFELHAVGPAGSQVAIGALVGSYRYLVIESADPSTPMPAREQADRALESFQPR